MRNIAYLVSALLLAGCAGAQEDVQLIPDFNEFSKGATLSWNDAWMAGDVDGVVGRYADDAMLLPPNADPVVGKAAITEYWAGGMAAAPIGTITWQESFTGGDLGYVRGVYEILTADSTQIDSGKYVEIWQIVDGDWKMTRDIWNSSLPLPDAGADM